MPYGEEELLSQSVNGVSASAFKVTLIPENDYITMTWKNGAGTADEILIEPYGVDFKTQPFFWRFSRSEVCENVTFSIFPGYEISVIPLPTTNSEKYFKLRHNDQVIPQSVKVLIPYTYDGSLLTKCEVGGPRSYLMLLTNYKKIRDDISVENIDTDNGFRKLILAPSTIIYLVDGHITISMDSFPETDVIPGQTIHIECGESASPKYLQVNVQSKKNATFVLISLHDKSIPLWNELVSMPSSLSIDEEVVQRDRRGSVLVYDELPVFAVPDDRLPAFPLIIALSPKMHRVSKNQVYTPPSNSLNRSDIAPIPIPNACDKLNLDSFPVGKISTTWINMIKQAFSEWIKVPCIVARGRDPNEIVLGITAALHGNEVNGISCIQRLMQSIDISRLRGTIVAIPCLNVPGYTNFKREFKDGKDLNRLFPGNLEGTSSQVYAYSIMEKIVNNFNYLIDLHTASFGRVNSYYVRADMNDPVTATLARLQGPQIVLHNSGQDGTLRSAASQKGIKSITVEIGNPQQFQTEFIQWSYVGLMRILKYLEMYPRLNDTSLEPQPNPSVLCSKGFWTYTRTGGVLEVYPEVNTFVKKGLLVACIRDIFGNIVDEYFAPCDSIVIGCSSNPVASTGDRIIHFGVPLRKGEQLPAVAKENY